MLSYEPGEMQRFGWSRSRLRLELLRLLQNRSLRHAAGAIFLSGHAAEMIQRACGRLPRVTFIPHGVGEEFRHQPRTAIWPVDGARPVRCVYVSRAALYKHQWMVVRAIAALRDRGNAVTLTLIGGGCGRAQQRLDAEIDAVDPERSFVDQRPFVPHGDLPAHLADADVFVFASSCENLPNTLIEAMAVGLPIACSDRGPMPEVLQDGGVYFDPEDPTTIAEAVARLLADAELRQRLAARARELAAAYSWRRCSDETWAFLVSTYRHCQAGRARQS
jgi:glycosyltransferase involved in cell wall biosynthesis